MYRHGGHDLKRSGACLAFFRDKAPTATNALLYSRPFKIQLGRHVETPERQRLCRTAEFRSGSQKAASGEVCGCPEIDRSRDAGTTCCTRSYGCRQRSASRRTRNIKEGGTRTWSDGSGGMTAAAEADEALARQAVINDRISRGAADEAARKAERDRRYAARKARRG
jgi:hypothetical protein